MLVSTGSLAHASLPTPTVAGQRENRAKAMSLGVLMHGDNSSINSISALQFIPCAHCGQEGSTMDTLVWHVQGKWGSRVNVMCSAVDLVMNACQSGQTLLAMRPGVEKPPKKGQNG